MTAPQAVSQQNPSKVAFGKVLAIQIVAYVVLVALALVPGIAYGDSANPAVVPFTIIGSLAMIALLVSETPHVIYTAIALIGLGNSNVFSIIFSQALLALPEKKNEISGLMIMGLFGGTIFPLLMGFMSDAMGQNGAIAVMTVGVLYLLFYTAKIKR